jgi:hypothetical protein
LDLDTGINAIAVDGDDNIYATGAFQTLAAAQLEGTHDLAAELVFSDVFVSKFGEQGPIWIRTFGGSDTDEGTAIAVDPHGGVYVAGGFSGQVDFNPGEGIDLHKSISCEWRSFLSSSSDPVLIKQDSLDEYVGSTDAFLSKLDTSGNFIWAQTWGGNEWDSPGGVVVDSDGRIRVAGTLGHGGFLREFGADGIRTR